MSVQPSGAFSRVLVIASPRAESTLDFVGPQNLLGPSEARGDGGRGQGYPSRGFRVGGPVDPEVEAGRGDVHPGRVGRDNHRTDTDMLIPESFTRDI